MAKEVVEEEKKEERIITSCSVDNFDGEYHPSERNSFVVSRGNSRCVKSIATRREAQKKFLDEGCRSLLTSLMEYKVLPIDRDDALATFVLFILRKYRLLCHHRPLDKCN